MRDPCGIRIATVVHIRPCRGPFISPDKRGWAEKLIQIAALAYPTGSPNPWKKRGLSVDASGDIITELVEELFLIRNFTRPRFHRRYAVGSSCWGILGCALFGLLPSLARDSIIIRGFIGRVHWFLHPGSGYRRCCAAFVTIGYRNIPSGNSRGGISAFSTRWMSSPP